MEWLLQPWSPWVSGILIGFVVPALYLLAGKAFGISTSLQQIGAMCAPKSRLEYFAQYDRRGGLWTLIFVLGIVLGGFVGAAWLSSATPAMIPAEFRSARGALQLLVGGFLIGFGTRYAGGCTSGHSITGIANLNWPSLAATAFFFVGGLGVTWGLGRLLF